MSKFTRGFLAVAACVLALAGVLVFLFALMDAISLHYVVYLESGVFFAAFGCGMEALCSA